MINTFDLEPQQVHSASSSNQLQLNRYLRTRSCVQHLFPTKHMYHFKPRHVLCSRSMYIFICYLNSFVSFRCRSDVFLHAVFFPFRFFFVKKKTVPYRVRAEKKIKRHGLWQVHLYIRNKNVQFSLFFFFLGCS